MTASEMDPKVTRAVRDELAAIGTERSRLQRHQRRVRILAIGITAILVAGVTTGAAVLVNTFPGSTTVTPVGAIHSATRTGTGQLELGRAPTDATRVILTVRCLNQQGSISVSAVPQSEGGSGDFTTFYCTGGGRVDPQGRVRPWHIDDALLPPHGSTAITITADPGTTWAITGQYATSSTAPWAKNERGKTYGQCNVNGCPTLIGAKATNGKIGFVLSAQLDAFQGAGYIPVYASNGTTVIGRFSIGIEKNTSKNAH